MDRGEGGGGIVNRIASMLMEHIDQQISAQVSPIKDKLEKIEQKVRRQKNFLASIHIFCY